MNDSDLPDDRVTCHTCVRWRLGKCEARNYSVVIRLHRCEHYQPNGSDPDKRTGMQRWPNLVPKRS